MNDKNFEAWWAGIDTPELRAAAETEGSKEHYDQVLRLIRKTSEAAWVSATMVVEAEAARLREAAIRARSFILIEDDASREAVENLDAALARSPAVRRDEGERSRIILCSKDHPMYKWDPALVYPDREDLSMRWKCPTCQEEKPLNEVPQ